MSDLLDRLRAALADRYAIESEIGRGGMAVVFLAEDLKHHRQVALKVLHPELTATLGAERFLSEIEIVAGLQHPHILPLYDSGEADGLLYYVMPFARGESLRQRLDREKQLAVDESVRIAVEVADGLDYAHRQGVVHRDIKPGNILLSEKHAVIADFGIARAIEAARAERVTSTGLGVGTPLYASPEQATAEETLDGRTDIYSLGCMLYEMLAGEPPLTGATPQMTHARRISETPTQLHTLRDTVPPALDHVIARALARIPADRYATASQFGQALQAATFAATPTAMAHLAATPGVLSVTPAAVSGPTRKKVPVWLIVAVAVAGTAAGGWFLSQRSGNGEAVPEQATADAPEFQEVQLTSVGDVRAAEISPDGERVAYCRFDASRREDGARLVLLEIAEPEATRELARVDVCWGVRWLPDGSGVVLFGTVMGRDGWHVVSRYGSQPKPFSCAEGLFFSNWAVSPDGTRCASSQRDERYILVRSLDGSIPTDTIPVEGEYESLSVSDWLPGDRLVFTTGSDPGFGTIWTIGVDGADRDSVVSIENPFSWLWSPDGRALYYRLKGSEANYVMRLRIAEDGTPDGEPELLPSLESLPSVSADGYRAVVRKGTTRSRIVRVTADPEAGPPASVSSPVIDWIDIDGYAGFAVSHSGESIVYQSEEGLFKIPVEGGSPQLLATQGRWPVWSPDDRFVLYDAAWQGTNRLWITRADRRDAPGLVEDEVVPLRDAQWLGSQIFALTNDYRNVRVLDSLRVWSIERADWVGLQEATGADVDLRRGVRTQGRWLVTNDSVGRFLVPPTAMSPDGDQLFVVWRRTMDGSRATDSTTFWTTWRMSLDGTEQTRILGLVEAGLFTWGGGGAVAWTVEGLYWEEAELPALYLQPLDGGERMLLLEIPEWVEWCELRPGTPEIELVCNQTKQTYYAWLIENFDPHVN